MHIEVKEAVALATGIGGLLASIVATLRYFVKKEQLEGNLQRMEERFDELKERNASLNQLIGSVKIAGSAALLLKSEIDSQLEMARQALQATASSILVPLPADEPTDLIFLCALGPTKIDRAAFSIKEGISGHVFRSGEPYVATDARNDKTFLKRIDILSSYITKDVLCVPISSGGRTIGVLQFLNREDRAFSEQDLPIAERFSETLSVKVAQFLADPKNFELLGFASAEKTRDGTILFCDLTASSLLIDTMNFASAISLINSYLTEICNIAMHHGGTIDKLLWDGAMIRFNVPHEIRDSRIQAVRAAIAIREAFEKQKENWLKAGLPVKPVFNRIGMASGPVREAIMGHPQFQSLTVVGAPVILASNLCTGAPRDRNVILTTPETVLGLESKLTLKPLSQISLKKIKGQQASALELLGCTPHDLVR